MNTKRIGFMLGAALALTACGSQSEDTTPQTSAPAASGDSAQVGAEAPAQAQSASVSVVKSCNLETVDGEKVSGQSPQVTGGGSVRLTGWLIDEEEQTVPGQVMLKMKSKDGLVTRDHAVVMWRDRPDVASARGGPQFLKSGFSVDVDTKGMASDEYTVHLLFSSSRGESVCDVGRHVVLVSN